MTSQSARCNLVGQLHGSTIATTGPPCTSSSSPTRARRPAPNANFPRARGNPLGAVDRAERQREPAVQPKAEPGQRWKGDYQVATGQWIKGGYDFERIDRWCTGSWIDCADAGVTNENRAAGGMAGRVSAKRVNARDRLHLRRAPGAELQRERVPRAGALRSVSPAGATGGATAFSFMLANGWNGWGPPLGYSPTTGNMNLFFPGNNALANAAYANNNRISEILGLRRYYVSDRNRNRVRSAARLAGDRRAVARRRGSTSPATTTPTRPTACRAARPGRQRRRHATPSATA